MCRSNSLDQDTRYLGTSVPGHVGQKSLKPSFSRIRLAVGETVTKRYTDPDWTRACNPTCPARHESKSVLDLVDAIAWA